MTITISRTDLARNTREIIDQARRGQQILVQSYGEDQVVVLDALDYRLLKGLVNYAVQQVSPQTQTSADGLNTTLNAYLDGHISLSKAAEQLNLSRYELMERFERLGVPLRIGPASLDEARDEINAARQGKTNTP